MIDSYGNVSRRDGIDDDEGGGPAPSIDDDADHEGYIPEMQNIGKC